MSRTTDANVILIARCRTCEHIYMTHYPKLGMPNVPPLPCRERSCKCEEFLPEDNLEYLEYMNEKTTTVP